MSHSSVGLFAKEPLPGKVKTRLGNILGASGAAELYRAFLADAIAKLLRIDGHRVVAFSPPSAGTVFRALVPSSLEITAQGPGNLGARMRHFFAECLGRGATRVVLIGSDSPTLPSAWLRDALQALEHVDVVFGPALDGGYYLVGCRRSVPPIFEGIAWSTPGVLAQSLAHLERNHLSLHLLPPWYDIDTPAQLQMLVGHLAAMRRAGIEPEAPETERVLSSFLRTGKIGDWEA